MTEQQEFYAILDRYNAAIEPLENWQTADIVRIIGLMDAELQRRHDAEPVADYYDEQEYLEDADDYDIPF